MFNFIVLCSNQHIAIFKFCSSDLHSLAFGHKQKVMYHLESCKHLHLAGRRINHLQIKKKNKNNKSTRYLIVMVQVLTLKITIMQIEKVLINVRLPVSKIC